MCMSVYKVTTLRSTYHKVCPCYSHFQLRMIVTTGPTATGNSLVATTTAKLPCGWQRYFSGQGDLLRLHLLPNLISDHYLGQWLPSSWNGQLNGKCVHLCVRIYMCASECERMCMCVQGWI